MLQRILFRLTQSHLLVANTGKPFSKEGFEAVCYTDTSSKTGENATQAAVEAEAKSWVDDLIKNKRKTFSDPKQLQSASGTELRTAKDYSTRLLLELLQNAIDADREEQIGYKGIGFRSVLNDGEVIEIHSGYLHVRWSEADAREALKELGELPERLPILDLPAWNDPDDEAKALLKAGGTGSYDTVIRLQITDEGRQHVLDEWHKFADDPSLLLFIDGQIEISWEREETTRTWKRKQDGDIVTVSVENATQSFRELRWRSFESGHARTAYAVNEADRFQPSGVSEPRLRSYFPANLSSHPFPNLFLHHAKFELQSNRESVNPNDLHLSEVAQTMLKAAQSAENQNDLLDLLQVGSLDDNDKAKIDSKMWEAAKAALKEAPLPALGGRRLGEIKTCPHESALPPAWRGEARLKNWAVFLTALKETGARGWDDLPVLEPGVEDVRREATLLKFNPSGTFTQDQLRELKWVPVEGSPMPVSLSNFKVFLAHKGGPFDSPEGFEVRFLSSAFQNACGTGLESFLTYTLGVLKFTALLVIEHAVLPALTASQTFEPNDELIRFLMQLRNADQAELKKPVESFDWLNPVRRELIQKLHIGCQNRSWPILDVYAGEKWTGNRFLEEVFGGQRGYLEGEPLADKDHRKAWEDFWKWLGVGWCPKVLPVLRGVAREKKDKEGLSWRKGRFQGQFFRNQNEPESWSDYCEGLSADEGFQRWGKHTRMKACWTLDGGISLLTRGEAFTLIRAHWPAYQAWMTVRIGYSRNARQDDDNETNEKLPSHLAWLFRTAKWIPCTNGLHCGGTVFEASGEVAQELKAFVPQLVAAGHDKESARGTDLGEFLSVCGIRSKWDEVRDEDWRAWLNAASQMQPNSGGYEETRITIRGLYRAILNRRVLNMSNSASAPSVGPLNGCPLWSIQRRSDTDEKWHLLRTPNPRPFFVDRADVASVHLPELYLFPVRLDGLADRAKQHLNLRPLSEVLSGEPTEQGIEMAEFSKQTEDRQHELIAYLRVNSSREDDANLESAVRSVALRESPGLKVQFSVESQPMGKPLLRRKFPRFDEGAKKWIVYVNTDCPEEERWEAFAEALLLSAGLPTDKALNVRQLLRCKAEQLPERLINFGVAPETAEALRNRRNDRFEQPPVLPRENLEEAPTQGHSVHPSEPSPSGHSATHSPAEHVRESGKGAVGGGRSSGGSSQANPHPPGNSQRRPSSRPHPEEGLSAQRWLFEKVRQWCEERGLVEPIWEKERVDITIPLKAQPHLLIEAKRIDGLTIHWSRNQIKKAEEARGSYVVALLRPRNDEEENDVFWVSDPREAFLSLRRQVEWTWQVKKGEEFRVGSWDEPGQRPSAAADSFYAEITVDDDWLNALPRGIDELATIVEGIRNS